MRTSRAVVVAFWTVTALFCMEMIFTAYWEWSNPQAAQAFARLGFTAASFRVELSVAKILGVIALLIPASNHAHKRMGLRWFCVQPPFGSDRTCLHP